MLVQVVVVSSLNHVVQVLNLNEFGFAIDKIKKCVCSKH